MSRNNRKIEAWPRAGLGAAAGIAGTALLQRTIRAGDRWLPSTRAPLRRDPGAFLVEQVEQRLPERFRQNLPERARVLGAEAAHFIYGSSAGVAYALLRPRGGRPVRDGVLFGLGFWAAEYLGWLPRTGLTPPVRDHTLPQLAGEIGQMALFGMATAAAFTAVERLAERWFLPRVVARGHVRHGRGAPSADGRGRR